MKRTRWPALAVALGLFGTAYGDDPTWHAAKGTAPPPQAAVERKPSTVEPPLAAPKTAPKTRSAAEVVWRASCGVLPAAPTAAAPLTASATRYDDAIWRPSGSPAPPQKLPSLKRPAPAPRVLESSSGDLAPPRVIEGELSLGPRVDGAFMLASYSDNPSLAWSETAPVLMLPEPKVSLPPLPEVDLATVKAKDAVPTAKPPLIPIPNVGDSVVAMPPVVEKLAMPIPSDPPVIVLPLRAADKPVLQVQLPIPIPNPSPNQNQKPKEIAPPPAFIPGTAPKPAPPVVAAPPVVVPPKPTPPAAVPLPPQTMVASVDESTAVWGGYSNVTKPADAAVNGECPPVKHGVYGSANLELSRDYRFLDTFSKPLLGDDERSIFRERAHVPDSMFFEAEYLMWWVKNGSIPVLATTASGGGFGTLGDPRTTMLIGGGGFGESERNGVRLRAGYWLDDCQTCGFDASVFILGRQANGIGIDSAEFPTIARPFYAPNIPGEFSELVAYPGVSTGSLTVNETSFLWGADANFRKVICCDCNSKIEWFAGYRYLNLQETLSINEFITAGAGSPDPVGTKVVVHDGFTAKNNFNGGQAGLAGGWRFGNFSIDLRGSVALGDTNQSLSIDGYQTKTPPGQATQTFNGGLLAVGPNLGNFNRNRFSVVPETTINFGYNVLPHLKAYVGYNFIGWTNVIRPGEQIDRVVDLTYVPNGPSVAFSGQARPQPTFTQSNLWIQGIQFGLAGTW